MVAGKASVRGGGSGIIAPESTSGIGASLLVLVSVEGRTTLLLAGVMTSDRTTDASRPPSATSSLTLRAHACCWLLRSLRAVARLLVALDDSTGAPFPSAHRRSQERPVGKGLVSTVRSRW